MASLPVAFCFPASAPTVCEKSKGEKTDSGAVLQFDHDVSTVVRNVTGQKLNTCCVGQACEFYLFIFEHTYLVI